jgi:uncharacterized protein YbbC (DUF1343 family)
MPVSNIAKLTKSPAAIRNALIESVRVSKSPGAVVHIGDRWGTILHEATGFRQLIPAPVKTEVNTIYDLASLTKVVATTTAIMQLYEAGEIELDQPVSRYLPIPAFSAFTLRHCLTHSAGLVSGLPYFKECSSIDEMLQRYAELPLKWQPGTRWLYSDVGFMILGRVVELVAADSLDAYSRKHIFEPLKMTDTGFNPDTTRRARCAATEQCPWRGMLMIGQVHDENAYAVGGVAGHAGLFGTAADLAVFARAFVSGRILKPETLAAMTRMPQIPAWPWQGLGWQLDPWSTKDSGFLTTRTAMGHSGWTGTSLWMDWELGFFAIQLGNTCHPSRSVRNNPDFRRTFYSQVSKVLYPKSTNTHSGLDRLQREDFGELRGKRIALLTHHAAVDQLGRHILDVFALAPDVSIKLLYSPEHGIRGQAEAGQSVESERGDLPVISLYGERKQPTVDELRQVDWFVVDLQDVGARYYTYAATMKDCLEACAEAGVPVLVLDRPNPVGGAVLEGPIAAIFTSPVCWGAVPVRHGMTMGEIALYFQRTFFSETKLRLSVSTLDNWTSQQFNQCSLPWIPPSPNIPTAGTTLMYTGTCLFEGTNLNEGRGTETPFELIGAPWLDASAVLDALDEDARAGVRIDTVRYTPVAIPGKASNPRYQDQVCNGLRLTIQDPGLARPFTTTVALLVAIRKIHSREFVWGESFDVLAGSADLRDQIEQGSSWRQTITSFEPGLVRFDGERPRLYEPKLRNGA